MLILSMYSDERYVLRSVKAGPRGYVLKNSAGDELVQAILTVQKGTAFFSPAVARIFQSGFAASKMLARPATAPISSPAASARSTSYSPKVTVIRRSPNEAEGRVPVASGEAFESAIVKRPVYSSASGWPTRSTARKASCGISTRPTRFIRFLPSFCFSSSLRFRLMSPP